jgi:ketosteroid isomerase-like protein
MPAYCLGRAAWAAALLTIGACAPSLAPRRDSLLAADRAFAASADARGVDGWMAFFAGDAVTFPEGKRIVHDTAQVRAEMAPFFADSTIKLRWDPERAEIARSGELGYTYGYYRVVRRARGAADSQVVARGKYVTIWRRAPSGEWKVALDIGNGLRE